MTLPFDPLRQTYPSQRFPIYARNGMVNCSSPLASAAGQMILRLPNGVLAGGTESRTDSNIACW